MTKAIDNITADRLREVLSYDPNTGIFHWLKTLSVRAMAGAVAGSLKPSGYICINIDGSRHRAHRGRKCPLLSVDSGDDRRQENISIDGMKSLEQIENTETQGVLQCVMDLTRKPRPTAPF